MVRRGPPCGLVRVTLVLVTLASQNCSRTHAMILSYTNKRTKRHDASVISTKSPSASSAYVLYAALSRISVPIATKNTKKSEKTIFQKYWSVILIVLLCAYDKNNNQCCCYDCQKTKKECVETFVKHCVYYIVLTQSNKIRTLPLTCGSCASKTLNCFLSTSLQNLLDTTYDDRHEKPAQVCGFFHAKSAPRGRFLAKKTLSLEPTYRSTNRG